MSTCDVLLQNSTLGVAPALRAVDCLSQAGAAGAFARLFGSQGGLQPALTLVLTLYIGLFALALLTGRSRLSLAALSPRMLTLGLVLTFATSWLAYQSVVWNLVVAGPDEVARLVTGAKGSATQLFADRIDMILSAVDRISQDAQEQAANAGTAPAAPAAGLSAGTVMWFAALLLLLGTVGVLLTARIALAVLMALGPAFIVLALFRGTRGLAAGWLRGLLLTALTPLLVVVGGGVTLELVVPVIQRLGGIDGIDMRAAVALFLVASVHVALMALALKVAATIVAGWRVFGGSVAETERGPAPAPLPALVPVTAFTATASRSPTALSPAPLSAQEQTAVPGGTTVRREVLTQTMRSAPLVAPLPRRRAHGIGSRFPAHRMLR